MAQASTKPILVAQWGLLDELIDHPGDGTDADRFFDYLAKQWGAAGADEIMDPVVRVRATKSTFMADLVTAIDKNGCTDERNLQVIYIAAHGAVDLDDRPVGLSPGSSPEVISYVELGQCLDSVLQCFPHKTLVLACCDSLAEVVDDLPERGLQWVPTCLDAVIGFTGRVDPPDGVAALQALHQAFLSIRSIEDVDRLWPRFGEAYASLNPNGPKPKVFERQPGMTTWKRLV